MEKPFEFRKDEEHLENLRQWLGEDKRGADATVSSLKEVFTGAYNELRSSAGFSTRYHISTIMQMLVMIPLILKHKRLYILCDFSHANVVDANVTFNFSRFLEW